MNSSVELIPHTLQWFRRDINNPLLQYRIGTVPILYCIDINTQNAGIHFVVK